MPQEELAELMSAAHSVIVRLDGERVSEAIDASLGAVGGGDGDGTCAGAGAGERVSGSLEEECAGVKGRVYNWFKC